MDAKELRTSFREYMSQKGYALKPADSLVSDTFPTCFTVSGGPNFLDKHWQLCEFREPDDAAVIQPCHRFWDVPHVGDGKHLSCFEMAVTYSFDGQDREYMLAAHFDFITKELGLDSKRLTATTFGGGTCYGVTFPSDEVSQALWRKLGVQTTTAAGFQIDTRTRRLCNENFVATVVEPFGGPRTELFYDGLEIWTSVLYSTRVMYVNKGNFFHFVPYDYPTFAAGFGLERVLMAVNKLDSIDKVFTSPHAPAVAYDHVRGLTRLAHDCAFWLSRKNEQRHSNRGRISILNRYVRSLYERSDKKTIDALPDIVGDAILLYQDEQPKLTGHAAKISDLIRERAARLLSLRR